MCNCFCVSSLVFLCPLFVPHLSLICPPDLSCPQFPMLPALNLFLHFDYLDQSCSSCHQTSSHIHFVNLCFYCYPDVCLSVTQPCLSFPSPPFFPPPSPTFDFHFLPRHFTRHEHTHFSFVFLFPLYSSLPSLIFLANCYPHNNITTSNLLSCSFYLPAPSIIIHLTTFNYPDTTVYHVPPLSSHFHFPSHHFARHEPTLFSPYPLT